MDNLVRVARVRGVNARGGGRAALDVTRVRVGLDRRMDKCVVDRARRPRAGCFRVSLACKTLRRATAKAVTSRVPTRSHSHVQARHPAAFISRSVVVVAAGWLALRTPGSDVRTYRIIPFHPGTYVHGTRQKETYAYVLGIDDLFGQELRTYSCTVVFAFRRLLPLAKAEPKISQVIETINDH